MTIPFRVKLLTPTAKTPHRNCESDLWDLFADDFCFENLKDVEKNCNESWYSKNHQDILFEDDHLNLIGNNSDFSESKINSLQEEENICELHPHGRILVKTGIALELPILWSYERTDHYDEKWLFKKDLEKCNEELAYSVADLRPRSGLALKHGITILNSPGTIDNSYRKEIGVILINHGHEPYTIKKGDKIAQMLIRPLYPSKMEIVDSIDDTGRGGYGSTGK